MVTLISCGKQQDDYFALECGLDRPTCFCFIVENEPPYTKFGATTGCGGVSPQVTGILLEGSSTHLTNQMNVFSIELSLNIDPSLSQYNLFGIAKVHINNNIELEVTKGSLKVEQHIDKKIFRAIFEIDAYDDVQRKIIRLEKGIIQTRIFTF
ncbi:MAG: hypothetical protein IPG12_03190 [Saprospiraceae bacterium]|nr:hypothetical protein [Saprospiraceae bacterium]